MQERGEEAFGIKKRKWYLKFIIIYGAFSLVYFIIISSIPRIFNIDFSYLPMLFIIGTMCPLHGFEIFLHNDIIRLLLTPIVFMIANFSGYRIGQIISKVITKKKYVKRRDRA